METKVKTLVSDGEYKFKDKPYWRFKISFENGEHGQCSATRDSPPYGIGDAVTIEQNGEYEGEKKWKVQKADKEGCQGGHGGGGGSSGKGGYDAKGQQIGNALSNATKLIIANSDDFTEENVLKYARVFFKCAGIMRGTSKPATVEPEKTTEQLAAEKAAQAEAERVATDEASAAQSSEPAAYSVADDDVPF